MHDSRFGKATGEDQIKSEAGIEGRASSSFSVYKEGRGFSIKIDGRPCRLLTY